MEIIKEFTVGLVVICIVGSVVLILTPEGVAEKQVKTAVSLMILLNFILPFYKNVDLNSMFDMQSYEEYKGATDTYDLPVRMFKDRLELQINELLTANDIIVDKIEIYVHINDLSEILIDSVVIYLSQNEAEKSVVAESLIKETFGIICRTEVN